MDEFVCDVLLCCWLCAEEEEARQNEPPTEGPTRPLTMERG